MLLGKNMGGIGPYSIFFTNDDSARLKGHTDMINEVNLIETLENRLKKIPVGTCLDVRSYKRDRKILVIKKKEDELLIIEEGFSSRRYAVPVSAMKKLMKELIKREFPRSTKIRIYTEERWSEMDAEARKRI